MAERWIFQENYTWTGRRKNEVERERTEMRVALVLAGKMTVGETGRAGGGMTGMAEDQDQGVEIEGETGLCLRMSWPWKSGKGLRKQKE